MGDFATCTSDEIALGALPALTPAKELVQQGPGGHVGLEIAGRDPEAWYPSNLPYRPDNDVVGYVYGRCAFADMGAALATATTDEHRIYILGWSTNKDTVLAGGKTLEQYLSGTKAQIRAMFWDGIVLQPVPVIKVSVPTSSVWIKDLINKLPNGGAIMDAKHAQPATHHQKVLVVQGAQGVIAFVGGMDIEPNRTMVNPNGTDTPWHDTMVRLIGGAALDCRSVFQQRWLDHPDSAALDKKLGVPASDAFPTPLASQQLPSVTRPAKGGPIPYARTVRIGRTFPNLRKTGLGLDYSFAPQGDYTAWSLIEHAISMTQKWIYLEDQYMVSRMARQLLLAKLQQPGFEQLIILMNSSGAAAADFKYLVSERNRFRQDLLKIDKSASKWSLFTLKAASSPERQQWCGDYMHSKTWIFDDEFTIIGSANCENRGYTLNTEVVAAIGDTRRINAIGAGFARLLRIALWHKHLGVPHAQLQDWSSGVAYWKKLPGTAMVQLSNNLEPDGDLGGKYFPDSSEQSVVEKLWTTLCDPDAR